MKRSAIAIWYGSGKDGFGSVITESRVLNKAIFSFHSRFAESRDTNPEELMATAHASSFVMKLSFVLGESGFIADKIETTAIIHFENGTTITESHLIIKAKVSNMSHDQFEECIENAESNCPVSKVLNARITWESELENK